MAGFGDDNDIPVLSSSALEALKGFYTDRDAHQKQFEDLKANAENELATDVPLSMDAFAEDWNESQFWYSQDTATVLAKELLRGTNESNVIAVVSAPSVFVQLKNCLSSRAENLRPRIHLLEFDKRFEVFSEFHFYDFNQPFKLPPSLKGTADRVICDPPFLSEDCQTQAAMTVRWLSKETPASQDNDQNPAPKQPSKLIVCTGERMEGLVTKLYRSRGLKTTTFQPVHAKGLSNIFYCFANFECERWTWKKATA